VFFLLDHVLDLFVLLVKVTALLGFGLVVLSQDLMLGEEEVRVVLCLLDEAVDGLFSRGIRWWLQGL
jgi:hypothetical protein